VQRYRADVSEQDLLSASTSRVPETFDRPAHLIMHIEDCCPVPR
jgi:hypothetical protein